MEYKGQIKDLVGTCVVSTQVSPDKAYLGTTERNFIKRFQNHSTPFNDFRTTAYRMYANDTTLAKYI